MAKRKDSEECALRILSSLGIEMDLDYYDDNSKKSI